MSEIDSIYRVVSALEAGIEALCDGFNRGFSDYKYGSSFDVAGMERFLERSGMQLADCAVLLVEDAGAQQGVGAAMLAVERDRAWCGGLAVDPAHRRRGGACALMQTIQARARQRGAAGLQLEVLAENQPAQDLYHRLGYQRRRQLLLWQRVATLHNPASVPIALQPADPTQVVAQFHAWHRIEPAWQRRATYLLRAHSLMDALILPTRQGTPVGYALYHHNLHAHTGNESVHLFDIAVDPTTQVDANAQALIDALLVHFPGAEFTLVNEPAESLLNPIFQNAGFTVADRQYELALRL